MYPPRGRILQRTATVRPRRALHWLFETPEESEQARCHQARVRALTDGTNELEAGRCQPKDDCRASACFRNGAFRTIGVTVSKGSPLPKIARRRSDVHGH